MYDNIISAIHHDLVSDAERTKVVAERFGTSFIQVESSVFDLAASLSNQYNGGFWDFFRLSNGGFYMVPHGHEKYMLTCPNGYAGSMTADGFGITVCLYAYSLLSFSANADLAQICARYYHLLRDFLFMHDEAEAILSACD